MRRRLLLMSAIVLLATLRPAAQTQAFKAGDLAFVVLQAPQVTALVNGTTTRTTTSGLDVFTDAAILLNITGSGAVTGTLQLWIEDSYDGGTTWDDLCASNTFAFGAAAVTQRFFLSGKAAFSGTQASAAAVETMAAATCRGGAF